MIYHITEQIDFKLINHRFIDKYQALGFFVGKIDEYREHFTAPEIVKAEKEVKKVIRNQSKDVVIDSKLEHIRFRLYREV